MRVVRVIVFTVLIFMFFSAVTYAGKKEFYLGVGIGIPYGGIGANIEAGRDIIFTAGIGLVPFTDASANNSQIGWSTWLKYYFKGDILKSVKSRASLLWGTVGVGETVFTNLLTGQSQHLYQLQTGFAPGLGLRGENWDFDISYPFYNLPSNYSNVWGTVKFSFGFRF